MHWLKTQWFLNLRCLEFRLIEFIAYPTKGVICFGLKILDSAFDLKVIIITVWKSRVFGLISIKIPKLWDKDTLCHKFARFTYICCSEMYPKGIPAGIVLLLHCSHSVANTSHHFQGCLQCMNSAVNMCVWLCVCFHCVLQVLVCTVVFCDKP